MHWHTKEPCTYNLMQYADYKWNVLGLNAKHIMYDGWLPCNRVEIFLVTIHLERQSQIQHTSVEGP